MLRYVRDRAERFAARLLRRQAQVVKLLRLDPSETQIVLYMAQPDMPVQAGLSGFIRNAYRSGVVSEPARPLTA